MIYSQTKMKGIWNLEQNRITLFLFFASASTALKIVALEDKMASSVGESLDLHSIIRPVSKASLTHLLTMRLKWVKQPILRPSQRLHPHYFQVLVEASSRLRTPIIMPGEVICHASNQMKNKKRKRRTVKKLSIFRSSINKINGQR